MPASAPALPPPDRDRLTRLGERLRLVRKQQRVSAVAAAEAAGISRVTLHRIERGAPSVAIGAWAAAASALGLSLDLQGDRPAQPALLPDEIHLDAYPQLRALAWQLDAVATLTPREALDLYERNWRHIDKARLSAAESALIDNLSRSVGAGRLLV